MLSPKEKYSFLAATASYIGSVFSEREAFSFALCLGIKPLE